MIIFNIYKNKKILFLILSLLAVVLVLAGFILYQQYTSRVCWFGWWCVAYGRGHEGTLRNRHNAVSSDRCIDGWFYI